MTAHQAARDGFGSPQCKGRLLAGPTRVTEGPTTSPIVAPGLFAQKPSGEKPKGLTCESPWWSVRAFRYQARRLGFPAFIDGPPYLRHSPLRSFAIPAFMKTYKVTLGLVREPLDPGFRSPTITVNIRSPGEGSDLSSLGLR
jgi:hypothetical protein